MPHLKLHCTCQADSVRRRILQTDKDRLNDSYTALERKAQLYDKLVQGHVDDDDEQYNVDFLRKGFLVHEDRNPSSKAKDGTDRAIDTAGMAVSSSGACVCCLCWLHL